MLLQSSLLLDLFKYLSSLRFLLQMNTSMPTSTSSCSCSPSSNSRRPSSNILRRRRRRIFRGAARGVRWGGVDPTISLRYLQVFLCNPVPPPLNSNHKDRTRINRHKKPILGIFLGHLMAHKGQIRQFEKG